MDNSTRACVAFVAGHIISGMKSNHIYDYSEARYIEMGVSITESGIDIFDYERRCYIWGSLSSLYNSCTGTYLQLSISGNLFSGYDDATRHNFTGEVNGDAITIYDDVESQYFSYRF